MHPQLFDIFRQIRTTAPNIKTKLDTNGTRPDIIKKLVSEKRVDLVAVDIKAPIAKYTAIAGFYNDGIPETVNFLKHAGVNYMFRTTISPFLDKDDIETIGKQFINGTDIWQIQQFNPNDYSNSFDTVLLPYTPEKVREFAEIAKNYTQHVVVRGA
jgi:pyruvate formate lyase activating enzyme